MLYTNRRRISRWFQKCIALYAYFAYFLTYDDFKAKKGPELENGPFLALQSP